LNRRVVLQSALVAPGLAGAALAGCSAGSGRGAVATLANDYVAAPPLPRNFTPPPALERSGEGYVELPSAAGARLYYWDTGGDGEAIVLSHAATGSAYVWGYQQRTFTDAGYRVIAYSRRGYRSSDTGPVDENNRARAGSGRPLDDLAALVDHLGLDRFHLLGQAGGGGIANGYMKEHPERIRTAISVTAIQGVTDADWLAPMTGIRPPGNATELGSFNSNPAQLREVGPSYRWANPEGLAAWIELEHTNRPVVVDHPVGVELTWADIESRTFPTLLIAGDADLYAPPSMYRYLHSRVPNSELYVISESGHSVYWEQPSTFNAIVLDFLGRHSG
jgi:pimeloyl-ACP methyl ester carboxylesterase